MKPQPRRNSGKHKKEKSGIEKSFEDKESYRWVEAIKEVKRGGEDLAPHCPKLPLIHPQTRVIHVFDREGDIAEVCSRS